jgi:hypothetical protein
MKNILFLISVLIMSCSYSPQPLIRLNADVNQSYRWVSGKKLLEVKKGNIEVYLSYQESNQKYHIFKIHIHNKSQKEILFDPAESFLMSMQTIPKIKQFASDPEDMLVRLDSDYSRKIAHHQSKESVDSFFSTLDLISEIASIGEKKTTEERLNEEIEEINEREYNARNEHRKQIDLYKIQSKKEFWKTMAIRKESITENQSIIGLILFPYDSRMNEISVNVLVDNKKFFFYFKKETIPVKMKNAWRKNEI